VSPWKLPISPIGCVPQVSPSSAGAVASTPVVDILAASHLQLSESCVIKSPSQGFLSTPTALRFDLGDRGRRNALVAM
jgi:hypothetical protein